MRSPFLFTLDGAVYNVCTQNGPSVTDGIARIGVREFREELAQYLASDKPVAVTRHGLTVGYFIPTRGGPEGDRERAIAELRTGVERMEALLAELGVTEDDVVREFSERRRASRKK
jgi:hypothetical protein